MDELVLPAYEVQTDIMSFSVNVSVRKTSNGFTVDTLSGANRQPEPFRHVGIYSFDTLAELKAQVQLIESLMGLEGQLLRGSVGEGVDATFSVIDAIIKSAKATRTTGDPGIGNDNKFTLKVSFVFQPTEMDWSA